MSNVKGINVNGYIQNYDSVVSDSDDDLLDAHGDIVVSRSNEMTLTQRMFPTGFLAEANGLFKLAWPMVLTQLSQYLFSPIATIFCGHLGKIELDAVALANSLINVTGLWIIVGMSSACDTLFAQTFGSENKQQLGVVLQRSIIILVLAVFPCWAIHLNAEPLLLALGQNPDVARLAGEYLLIFMPGLFFFSLYIPLSKYIQNQNIVLPNLIIGFISNGMCALFHYIFIYLLNYQTNGSAISQAIGYFFMMACTLLYIVVSKVYKDTWTGWSKESLKGWGSFIYLSTFGMIMLCIEWWTFEIAIFLAGVLGTTELGAQTIVFQIATIVYMLPLGIGIAASIRVGQYLGSGNAAGAKTAARVAFVTIGCTATFMAILVASLRNQLPKIFTNVEEVIELSATVLPVLAVYMLFDGAGGVGNGILRGMGRQRLGAAIISIAYAIGLSVGVSAMLLTELGIVGYWYALAATLAIEGTTLLIAINVLTKWDKEVDLAMERTKLEKKIANADNIEDEEPIETTAILNHQPKEHLARTYCYRIIALVICLSALLVGIIVRMFLPVPDANCLQPGVTQQPNNTLPYCNTTDIISLNQL